MSRVCCSFVLDGSDFNLGDHEAARGIDVQYPSVRNIHIWEKTKASWITLPVNDRCAVVGNAHMVLADHVEDLVFFRIRKAIPCAARLVVLSQQVLPVDEDESAPRELFAAKYGRRLVIPHDE